MHSLLRNRSSKINFNINVSNLFSSGDIGKRKLSDNELDERSDRKRLMTEEKVIKDLQALSLSYEIPTSNRIGQFNETDDRSEEEQDDVFESNEERLEIQLHQALRENLMMDDLQEEFIHKMYNLECKKLSLQIVPYMPIHPAQLNNSSSSTSIEKKNDDVSPSPTLIPSPTITDTTVKNDDHLFKRPFPPEPYTVEEPCDPPTKASNRMKRSYSQSQRSSNNLSVIELKDDLIFSPTENEYFVVEPSTPTLVDLSSSNSSSSLSSLDRSSVRITEFVDPLARSTSDHSDPFNVNTIDMHRVVLSDIDDTMEADVNE